jgi:hypothetical protein
MAALDEDGVGGALGADQAQTPSLLLLLLLLLLAPAAAPPFQRRRRALAVDAADTASARAGGGLGIGAGALGGAAGAVEIDKRACVYHFTSADAVCTEFGAGHLM